MADDAPRFYCFRTAKPYRDRMFGSHAEALRFLRTLDRPDLWFYEEWGEQKMSGMPETKKRCCALDLLEGRDVAPAWFD